MRPRGLAALLPTLALLATATARADVLPTLHGPVIERGWVEPDPRSPGAPAAERLFADLARDGASAVAVDVVALIGRADSPFLEDPRTPRPVERARLAWTVRRARHHGLRPVLRARVDRLDGGPRAAIAMRDEAGWSRFFDALSTWCAAWARDAETLGFDLFVLPSDLGGTSHRTADWRRVIAAVRTHYSGPVVYGADPVDEIARIRFWDALDGIGVATLPPVARPGDDDPTPRPRPTVWSATDEDSVAVHEIARALRPVVESVDRVATRTGRPVVLTGPGYRAAPRAWSVVEGPVDRFASAAPRDQARAVAGALRAFHGRPWLRGSLWRSVAIGDDDAGATVRSTAVRGVRGREVLASFWQMPTPDGGGRRVVGTGGAVASEDSLATAVGLAVLRDGGRAADAAVAMAFALAVTRPDAVGPGGGGIALVHDRRRGSRVVDFGPRAPLGTHAFFFEDLAAEGLSGDALDGPVIAAVPGFAEGLHAIWSSAGDLPWDTLLEPAFRAALDGVRLPAATARALAAHRGRLQGYASTRDVFLPGGRSLRTGDVLRRPRLAETLLALRREGPAALRHGTRARRLVEGVQRAGGAWTEADLAAPRPPRVTAASRRPLTRDGRVELHGRRDLPAGAVDVVTAWSRRPVGAREPGRAAVALTWADALGAARPDPIARQDAGGTGFVVFDAHGGAVVAHFDRGRPFGCGWVDPASGLLLNASMLRFDAAPPPPEGRAARAIVRPGAIAPSPSVPVLAVRDGRAHLGLVARDGDGAQVVQALHARLDAGWPLERAVAAPRITVGPSAPTTETGRVWPRWAEALPAGAPAPALLAIEAIGARAFAAVIDPRTGGRAGTVDPPRP